MKKRILFKVLYNGVDGKITVQKRRNRSMDMVERISESRSKYDLEATIGGGQDRTSKKKKKMFKMMAMMNNNTKNIIPHNKHLKLYMEPDKFISVKHQ